MNFALLIGSFAEFSRPSHKEKSETKTLAPPDSSVSNCAYNYLLMSTLFFKHYFFKGGFYVININEFKQNGSDDGFSLVNFELIPDVCTFSGKIALKWCYKSVISV